MELLERLNKGSTSRVSGLGFSWECWAQVWGVGLMGAVVASRIFGVCGLGFNADEGKHGARCLESWSLGFGSTISSRDFR